MCSSDLSYTYAVPGSSPRIAAWCVNTSVPLSASMYVRVSAGTVVPMPPRRGPRAGRDRHSGHAELAQEFPPRQLPLHATDPSASSRHRSVQDRVPANEPAVLQLVEESFAAVASSHAPRVLRMSSLVDPLGRIINIRRQNQEAAP